MDPSEEHERVNLPLERYGDIAVRDVRGYEPDFSLEKNGFCVLKSPTKVNLGGTTDEQEVRRDYLLEVINLVKSQLGADFVVCYQYRVRKCPLE